MSGADAPAPDAARNVRRLMAVARRVCGIYVRVKAMRVSEGVGSGCERRRLYEKAVAGEASDAAAAECDYW